MNHEMQYGVAGGSDRLDDGAGDGVGSALVAPEGCGVLATRRARARKRPAMSLEDAMAAAAAAVVVRGCVWCVYGRRGDMGMQHAGLCVYIARPEIFLV
jgi:hypothetical protein